MCAAAIDYGSAALPVRAELGEAHREAWARLARPGSFWSGAERVAIAAEVRRAWDCPLCRERRQALSPEHAEGAHACGDALPGPAVEAVHRITTDPGRLSRAWRERLRAAGLDDGRYVELVGVLVTVVSVDAFCRGLGLPRHPLPEPRSGEPDRRRPPGLTEGEAWVPMLDPRRTGPAERDLFPGGRTANVLRALSLVPDEVRTLKRLSAAHYMLPAVMLDLSRGTAHLTRPQVELVAARVSALRECFY